MHSLKIVYVSKMNLLKCGIVCCLIINHSGLNTYLLIESELDTALSVLMLQLQSLLLHEDRV
jgi:hypothetical protein